MYAMQNKDIHIIDNYIIIRIYIEYSSLFKNINYYLLIV